VIDIDAALELIPQIDGLAETHPLHRLLDSIDMEYGIYDQVAIRNHVQEGHTEHCAKWLVWGDGNCVCAEVSHDAG